MITVRLKGGLGNQMFQYAFGLKVAQMLESGMELDLSSLLDRSKGDFVYREYDLDIFMTEPKFSFNPSVLRTLSILKSSRVTKYFRRKVNRNNLYVKEEHFHYQPELLSQASDNTVYEGWFQSPKYFVGVEEILRDHFSFRYPLSDIAKSMLDKININTSVCLNVRRTDFVENANLNTTGLSYFRNAAIRMIEEVGEVTFFIFSDDVEWCCENIQLDSPMHIVDHSYAGFKFSNYLELMSCCDHFIIPNSSFAWWAIWLRNNSHSTVIAPSNWFNDQSIRTEDLIDDSWIRV